MKPGFPLLASLFCLGFVLFGCESDDKAMPMDAPAPARYQTCAADSQCVLVDISCSGCCERDAVNRADSARYMDYKKGVCVGNPAAICGCCYILSRAACVEGRCTLQVLEQKCED